MQARKKAAGDSSSAVLRKVLSWLLLLTLGAEHLYRGIGLLSSGTGLHGLLLRHEVLGHSAKLGCGLSLAAAGAESNGAGNGNDESGEFHKTEYG